MTAPPLDRLLDSLLASFAAGTLVKVTLSAPRQADADLHKLLLRPVVLRAGPRLSCTFRHRRRDVTKNLTLDEGVALVRRALEQDFACAHLFSTTATLQYEARAGRAVRLHRAAPRHDAPPSLEHDRSKVRALESDARAWLGALGVTTAEGRARKGMEGKLRQIDKFVELLAHHVPADLRGGRASPLRVVDMGAGKGYLTFATAAWLQQEGIAAEVCGVEARPELVAQANAVAAAHGFADLRFEEGAIAARPPLAADIVLALHACDTATDDALAQAVAAGARLILASPCCHRELRPLLLAPPGLAPILRHGILCERLAELVTDALRAALLGAVGYAVDVFEFVASEHSAKNLMLVATRRTREVLPPDDRTATDLASADRTTAAGAARALAQAFGVRQQSLAGSLGIELS